MATKLVNGIRVTLTSAEETARQAEETAWTNGAFDRAIKQLRDKRDRLLAETDFHGMSDNTMSAAMTTYRQDLRDITNGISTVAQVNAVVFPTKP